MCSSYFISVVQLNVNAMMFIIMCENWMDFVKASMSQMHKYKPKL